MRRHSLNFRQNTYNEGQAFQLIPTARIEVCPGVSCEFNVSQKFQTAAFSRNLLCSAHFETWYFYVPHRLVWDDWTGFITQDDDFAGTFPETTTTWAFAFDRSTASVSALYRRAYKLVYNQFFGNEDANSAANTWYSDITTDTDVTRQNLRTSDQFTGLLQTDEAIADTNFSGAAFPIELNQFHAEMVAARSKRRANMSGDKYVDAMRRMGVELNWMVQQAPEYLGKHSKTVYPVKTFNTGATGLGDSVARYEGSCDFKITKKRFAEHGYIVGVSAIRPVLYNSQYSIPLDGLVNTISEFYLGDNTQLQDTYNEGFFAVAGVNDMYSSRFARLRHGTNRS